MLKQLSELEIGTVAIIKLCNSLKKIQSSQSNAIQYFVLIFVTVSMFPNDLEEFMEDRAVFWNSKPEKLFHYKVLDILAKIM